MTQHYLIGQFSVLLVHLQPSPGDSSGAAVDDLRKEVELSPAPMLPLLASQVMVRTDQICCGALERGDTTASVAPQRRRAPWRSAPPPPVWSETTCRTQ